MTVIVADFSSGDGLHVNPLAPQLIRSREGFNTSCARSRVSRPSLETWDKPHRHPANFRPNFVEFLERRQRRDNQMFSGQISRRIIV